MAGHVAALVHLTALDRRRLARVLTDRLRQRLRAVEHIQHRRREIDATPGQILQQFARHRGVLARSLPQPQNRFRPVHGHSQRRHQVLALELNAVDVDDAEFEFIERAL